MRAGREEALDIFRKWFNEKALLRVDFSFESFAAVLRGRLFMAPDKELRIVSDDSFSEVTIDIESNVQFEYGEPDDKSGEAERSLWERGVVILLPGSDDRIDLSEFKDADFNGRS